VNVPSNRRWIALVERGSCKFNDKIHNAAVEMNASAVVIYDHKDTEVRILLSPKTKIEWSFRRAKS
jgi:hypothetical protein